MSTDPVNVRPRHALPLGLKWRCSVWFVTLVVGYGITVDLLAYAVIIPVVPFQLQRLGYHNVSGLTAYLLLSYSIGVVLSTPPMSWLAERTDSRRMPFIFGLVSLMAFMVMFMEAPTFWVMLVARFLQGISSSAVWVVGLALLCDAIPEAKAGQQIGLAMIGLTVGFLAAPPVGGALYDRFGFRAPFIFGIIVAAIDFVGRILIIERREALRHGYDPASKTWLCQDATGTPQDSTNNKQPTSIPDAQPQTEEKRDPEIGPQTATAAVDPPAELASMPASKRSTLQVLIFMLKSSRTLSATASIFIYGVVYTSLEPTLPLHIQDVWAFTPGKVGLIFLAIAIPAIIAAPLSGWLADRWGIEWMVFISFLTSASLFMILIIRSHIALFIVAIVFTSFFISAVISPLTAEMAMVTRTHDGIGYGHVYGAYNMAYGLGSSVGPVIAGQIYDHSRHGWTIVCSVATGLLLLGSMNTFFFTGERPVIRRLLRSAPRSDVEPTHSDEAGKMAEVPQSG